VEIDRYLVEVVRDHVNNIVHYRDKLLREPHRPTYHFVVPEGIAEPFDPNGAIYWNGRYHLFYIFQERRPRDGYRGDSWGHVSSHDLVHWRWHPTALEPSGLEVAIYSGNAFINKEGVPTIVYQGLGAGNCIATSTDPDLNVWEKSPHNPVIPYPEIAVDEGRFDFRAILSELPDYGKYDVWDPHAWLEGDTYYMICGNNSEWPYDKPTLWKSEDLIDWEFIGDFMHHDLDEANEKAAHDCPDFFKLGDKYVFFVLRGGTRYYIGEYKNEQFYPEYQQRLLGSLAPESMLDDKGRRICWAWAFPPFFGRRDEFILTRGWSGTMTLPRVLTMGDGVLHIEPVEELKSLRHSPVQLRNLTVNAGSEMKISQVSGDTLELELTIDPGDAEQCGIKVRCSPDGEEQTAITYNAEDNVIEIDLENSTLSEIYREAHRRWGFHRAPFELKPDEKLNLRIFLDRSIMEVYVNKRQCITQRIYPSRKDSQGLVLFAKGGDIAVPEFNAWKMHPSNPW
jgi:beta-fructofuranosidase